MTHWLKSLGCLLLCLCLCAPAAAEDALQAEDGFSLLLIGTDAYSEEERGRSDTIMLVRLDPARKTIRLVSFLRDLYVKIPGHGASRINASYAWGGAELLKETLEVNFGVTVDAYAEVNFERLVRVIDAIGGVTVAVSEAEREQLNVILRAYNERTGSPREDQLLQESGTVLLCGKQALCFSRIRKIDSDFQRTSRQREVIEAAFRQVMGLSPIKMTVLALNNLDAVTTDLGRADILRLAPMALGLRDAAFEAAQIPAAGAYTDETISGMAVLVPDLAKNRQALTRFLNGE